MADMPPQLFRTFDRKVTVGPENGFREGTKMQTMPVTYVVTGAGMGDFISYSPAFVWLAKNCPWVCGKMYVVDYMVPFFQEVMRPYKQWSVSSGAKGIMTDTSIATIAPNAEFNGIPSQTQLLNATGCHLTDLGFAYFTNQVPAPDEKLPFLEFHESVLPAELRSIRGKYVVFTPGSINSTRRQTGEHLNPLIDFVLEKGLTPVFLGKSSPGMDIDPYFPGDCEYEKGINLIDKTTVLEAAAIMDHAACVVGLDNGLLHLAACTKVPLVFGYTIAGPKDRKPRRSVGKTYDVNVTKEELGCANCQTGIKAHMNHSYHFCHYGDFKCIDLLNQNNGERWKAAIDLALKENAGE